MRLMAIITSAFIVFNTCFALDTKADMFDIGSPTPLAARLRQLTNGITANPTFTSVHVTGGVTANDFATRQGAGGPASGNGFNIGWGTGCATLWIDTTNLGCIGTGSSGSNSPAGSSQQLQFNNSGAFGGTTNLTWDGNTLNAGSQSDYLDLYAYGGKTGGTPVVGMSSVGGPGVWGASRGSDGNGAGIGVGAFAFADANSGTGDVWGFYGECRKYPSSSAGHFCPAMELDSTNLTNSPSPLINPYNFYTSGKVYTADLASGGGCASSQVPCYNPATGANNLLASDDSYALGILSNGAHHQVGIVFEATSITGADGTDSGGSGVAIAFARGQALNWYSSGNHQNFTLSSTGTSSGTAGSIVYANDGFHFQYGSASCTHTPTTGSETISCSSDERLKEDIKLYSGDALAFIDSFVIHDYKIKATGERAIGPIAQELQKSQPDLVHEGADGILTVVQPNLWKLVAAIQELNACQKSFMCRLYGR